MTTTVPSNILLARQPIYDRQLNLVAYELLFRPPHPSDWVWDGDVATSQLVINAFAEIGIDQVCDGKTAFINFTHKWVVNPPPFDAQHVTVEILEDVEPGPEVVKAVKALRAAGFTIALDDFEFAPKWVPLLRLAHIVKVDVLHKTPEQVAALVNKIAPFQLRLLAEKVEDYAMLEACKELGFELFQGFFLAKPQNLHGTPLPTNRIVVMRLLAELQDPEVSVNNLEDIISNDIALSTKLLRICNTARYTTQSKIDSIRRAVVLLGLQTLRQWSSLIALSRMSDKPSELICLTLARAKMMELLAGASGRSDTDVYFTVGMFSFIDAFFDQPKEALLKSLPFEEHINQALLQFEGETGTLLRYVIAHERGEWEQIDWQDLAARQIDESLFEQTYRESLIWATGIMQSLLD
ncbi:MAG: HDOD domain-containing protein [Pseudomonadota bacterium]|nr:EAL domain-containing protein [Pseudomonadales bacterium]MDY6918844.1 HDOD domain-containing protein [Pseudomonadota bacterium]